MQEVICCRSCGILLKSCWTLWWCWNICWRLVVEKRKRNKKKREREREETRRKKLKIRKKKMVEFCLFRSYVWQKFSQHAVTSILRGAKLSVMLEFQPCPYFCFVMDHAYTRLITPRKIAKNVCLVLLNRTPTLPISIAMHF